MSEFLEQHKRFLVGAFGAFLGFLIVWAIIGALFEDDIQSAQRSIARDKASARNAVPASVNLSQLKRSAAEIEEGVHALGDAVARDPGPFTLEGVSEPDLYYNRRVQELLGPERLQRLALLDVDFDESLGRPDKYPNSRAVFEWNLRGLDVVDQLMQWILRAHSEELAGGIHAVEGVEIVPAPKRQGSRGSRRQLVELHPVRFRVRGHPIGISYLIEKLAERPEDGRWLALLDARIESLDVPEGRRPRGASVGSADVGLVEAQLVVAAVDIDWEGAPEAPKDVR